MSKTAKPSCIICCENINKSTRKEIECMFCEFKSCRTCCESYLLIESTAKCMNAECGKEWTRKFLKSEFPTKFVNGKLKKHRENIIFERERSLMPATQPYAEVRKHNNILKECNDEIEKELRQLKKRMNEMRERKYTLMRNLMRTPDRGGGVIGAVGAVGAGAVERRQFIKPCPVDDCRGFLSSQWKCGLCSTWCCPDCHIIIGATKDAEHTCDPNNVESAKMLKAETKPCPKCAAAIYKIDGCDQMWCTMCHTAFSWRTGNIETKIHNPHYYEWLRKTKGSVPREPMEHACDQNMELGRNMIHDFERAFRRCRILLAIEQESSVRFFDQISVIIRYMGHLEMVEIHEFNYEAANRDLRIKYLINEISEEQLKTQLQQAEKKHNKLVEVNDIYRMVLTAVGDILNRFLRYLRSEPDKVSMEIFDELLPLKEYANECLMDIKHTYGSSSMRIFGARFNLTVS